MIPKKIHYCWFGGNPIPEKDQKCIESWKKFCPDYEIIQWNESNYDVRKNKFISQAYDLKKWAFVSDYARLDIIYNNGGIYLDTDVEIIKSFDELLENEAFMGFEKGRVIATGLGFGAVPQQKGIKLLRDSYDNLEFVNEKGNQKKADETNCPIINSKVLAENGAVMNDQMQNVLGITLYPTEYFCPLNSSTGILNCTDKTFSIHRYNMSWVSDFEKKWAKRQQRLTKMLNEKLAVRIIRILCIPDHIFTRFRTLGFKETGRFYINKFKGKND